MVPLLKSKRINRYVPLIRKFKVLLMFMIYKNTQPHQNRLLAIITGKTQSFLLLLQQCWQILGITHSLTFCDLPSSKASFKNFLPHISLMNSLTLEFVFLNYFKTVNAVGTYLDWKIFLYTQRYKIGITQFVSSFFYLHYS